MKLTITLAAAAIIAALLAWWGWDKAWAASAEVLELQGTIQEMDKQAKKTDAAMKERDATLQKVQTQTTEARLSLKEYKKDACDKRDLHPFIICVFDHTAGPPSKRGDAAKGCAHLAGQKAP